MSKKRKNGFKRFNKLSSLLVAKKALRKVKRLERKVEVKIFDIDITTLSPTIVGLLSHLNGIPQGDGVEQRDGLSCNMIGFQFNYRVIQNAAASTTVVRVIIVRDNRQVESTNPSVLDVILAADVMAQHSRVNPKRFTFYYDKIHSMQDSGTQVIARRIFKKARFKMQFIGAAGTTQTKNGLYLILMSDLGGNLPSLRFSFRIWFTDM